MFDWRYSEKISVAKGNLIWSRTSATCWSDIYLLFFYINVSWAILGPPSGDRLLIFHLLWSDFFSAISMQKKISRWHSRKFSGEIFFLSLLKRHSMNALNRKQPLLCIISNITSKRHTLNVYGWLIDLLSTSVVCMLKIDRTKIFMIFFYCLNDETWIASIIKKFPDSQCIEMSWNMHQTETI